jgi:membrane dipeptidase
MKYFFPATLVFTCTALTAQQYKKLHAKSIVVDTHNDILMKAADKGMVFDQDLTGKTHTDLDRWKKGGLDVQIFSGIVMVTQKMLTHLPTGKWIASMLW